MKELANLNRLSDNSEFDIKYDMKKILLVITK